MVGTETRHVCLLQATFGAEIERGDTSKYQALYPLFLFEVRETLEVCAHDCLFIRVEEIGEDAEVVASFWSSSEDPIVKSVITLEQIC